MEKILVAGAGKVGKLVALLLASTADYEVYSVDKKSEPDNFVVGEEAPTHHYTRIDVSDKAALTTFIKEHEIRSVISCLPYFYNEVIAKVAQEQSLNYFDLTEDISVSDTIKMFAQNSTTVFAPQCGLAPGFVSIAAHDLMQHFDKINDVLMRVGALPAHPNNGLKYALTWSTDGLINEYGNPCRGIVEGQEITLQPLEGLETIEIDGSLYEAFNTSGGLGTLARSYRGKVNTMNYKTLRYPGHCEKMRFLLHDLKLNDHRLTLKKILEHALPRTHQDVVLIYVAVNGYQRAEFVEETYVRKIYPHTIFGTVWSALQVTTAASVCAIVDVVHQKLSHYQGIIVQESFHLADFLNNRFGRYYNL